MIAAENVTITRSGRALVKSVDIALKPGCFTVVIGPNGAGKSTLMKVLSGEMQPDEGAVYYHGRDLALCRPEDLAKCRAVLPQATQLAFPFTALEITRMGAVAHGALDPSDQARKALKRAGLQGFERRPYPSLSGGEQQRVQFARALAQVSNPVSDGVANALFLDEPTASLDLGHQISVLETARDFVSAGGIVLAILHDLNLAAEFADHLVVLHNGKVVKSGACADAITDDVIAKVYGIGGAVGRLPAAHMPYVLPQSRHR